MKTIIRLLFLLLFMTLLSCQDENVDGDISVDAQIPEKDIELIKQIGFDVSTLIDMGDHYLVEGDICIKKSDLTTEDQVQLRQFRTAELISYSNQSNITVGVSNLMPTSGVDNWRTEIQKAINNWNSITGCRIRMIYTTSANPDIQITVDNTLQGHTVAKASWPTTGGKPGPTIWVNLKYAKERELTSSEKEHHMTHELGHCLGLRHSYPEIPEGVKIPGTPDVDQNSVMYSGIIKKSWAGFSPYDLIAIRFLYPAELPKVTDISGLQRPNVGEYAYYKAVLDYMPNEVTLKASEITYNWTVTGGVSYDLGANGAEIRVKFSNYGVFRVTCYLSTRYGNTGAREKKIEVMYPIP